MRWPQRILPLPCLLVLLVGCAGGDSPPGLLVAEPSADPFVGLEQLAGPAPLGGDLVAGKAGDWYLFNERLGVVISGSPRGDGFAVSAGNIVDAAPGGGRDLLREIFTYFNDEFPRQANYHEVSAATDSVMSRRTLIARGHDSTEPDLAVETLYRLDSGADYLEIRTTLTQGGTDTLVGFALGDAIQWGAARVFAPGFGSDLAGTRPEVPYLLGSGDSTAYGWVGEGATLDGPHGVFWSDPIVATVDLYPGQPVSYTRRLYIARGSAGDAGARIERDRGRLPGRVDVAVRAAGGLLISDAVVTLLRDGEPVTRAETGQSGSASVLVVKGEYEVVVSHPSHGRRMGPEVRVASGSEQALKVELPRPTTVRLSATTRSGQQTAARWVFRALGETPVPELERIEGLVAMGNSVYSAEDTLTLALAPGDYEVTATRGPGYAARTFPAALQAGQTTDFHAVLDPLWPMSGWVSMDLHVHGRRSPDSMVPPGDRLVSLAAEGIDWFASLDHGWRSDYESVPRPRLARSLRSLTGEEITLPGVHLGVFPVPPGEGVPTADVTPERLGVFLDALRAENPDALIQLNHPRSGRDGYFDHMSFSAETLTGEAGLRLDFDLIEVLNGKRPGGFDAAWADWLGLVASGRAPVAVGNSDCHSLIGGEVGYPRNLVEVGDEPVTPEALLRALRKGRVQVTNGPFIEFELEGHGPGDLLTRSQGTLQGSLRVSAPPWVDVGSVRIIVNGEVDSVFPVPGTTDPVRFDEPVQVSVLGSTSVIVLVEGNRGVADGGSGVKGGFSAVRRIAFTNPIWVDVPRASR